MGRSEGKNKLAKSLLGGTNIKIAGPRAKRKQVSLIGSLLDQIKDLRETALRDGFVGSAQVFDLKEIDLKGADLSGVNFVGSSFDSIDFGGASFAYVQEPDGIFLDDFASILAQTYIKDCNFNEASLNGVSFADAVISSSSFQMADLSNSYFKNAAIKKASFDHSYFFNTEFNNVKLGLNVDFQKAIFEETFIENTNCAGGRFGGAEFIGSEIIDSNLSYASFSMAKIDGLTIKLSSNPPFPRLLLRQVNFKKAQIYGLNITDQADLESSNFQEANVLDSSFTKTSFKHARFKKANFDNSVFTDCDFEGVDLSEASFKNCIFINSDLSQTLNQSDALFECCDFNCPA